MPQTRRHNFEIGPEDMEIGMGIHGEPGVSRERIRTADEIVDTIMDNIFKEMKAQPGDRVAVLVNSFGATPQMELYILFRRVEQRLAARTSSSKPTGSGTTARRWIWPARRFQSCISTSS